MLLFDEAIGERLGNPGKPLKPFGEKDGWLGDVSGWKEGGSEIAPSEKFKGNKAKACWFPDAKTAYAWQAFVTFKPQLKLKNLPGRFPDPGQAGTELFEVGLLTCEGCNCSNAVD